MLKSRIPKSLQAFGIVKDLKSQWLDGGTLVSLTRCRRILFLLRSTHIQMSSYWTRANMLRFFKY